MNGVKEKDIQDFSGPIWRKRELQATQETQRTEKQTGCNRVRKDLTGRVFDNIRMENGYRNWDFTGCPLSIHENSDVDQLSQRILRGSF